MVRLGRRIFGWVFPEAEPDEGRSPVYALARRRVRGFVLAMVLVLLPVVLVRHDWTGTGGVVAASVVGVLVANWIERDHVKRRKARRRKARLARGSPKARDQSGRGPSDDRCAQSSSPDLRRCVWTPRGLSC
jgi:hypothetical protein